MGISVEKTGVKPIEEQKTSSTEHAPEKTEQEESIFTKAKDTSWTTADTVSVVTGTILGLVLYRFMPKIAKAIKNRNANKNIIKAIENTIKKGV